MRYGSEKFIVEYEISALIFLAAVMWRYFATRRFPNQKNRLFTMILCLTTADMILDVVSSLIIENVFIVPYCITFAVNGAFYLLQIIMPMMMTLYALAIADPLTKKKLLRIFPIFIPWLTVLALLLTNPLTHWFFYVDEVRGYMHGVLFSTCYIACFFYMAATFCIAFCNRRIIRRDEFTTICGFLLIVLAAIVIQYIYPKLLISGVAMALAVMLMYFTIQNPESMLDTATGAFTYEAMLSFLKDRVQDRDSVSIFAFEIHNMHRLNELLGLENGSRLLRQIGHFLISNADNSWVFRMNSGCFAVITIKNRKFEIMSTILEQGLRQPWTVNNIEILLQATVCRISAEEALNKPISAEEAVNYMETVFLQNRRSGGRTKSIVVGQREVKEIERRRAVESALREALENGKWLELYYQPIWSVKAQRFVNAEALLRFNHPTLGAISPEEFVPIAESNGLIMALDELVLRKACEFIRDAQPHNTLGLDAIEINLSALEFMQNRLPELLDRLLAQYEIDVKHLFFEITETAATYSFELLLEQMQDMQKSGCRFALDDFGTGYANISQVIQLPFSMVKLDRSMLEGPEVVLDDMARMFKSMEMLTVAEGVESKEQSERMKALDVDYIQGFYYARPMDESSLADFLRDFELHKLP